MPCYSPLHGYKARRASPSGKRAVVFNVRDGFRDLPVTVPCGQCIGCRLERSRQWAVRIMHEASLHEENCFVTLTYRDEELPVGHGLDVKHFQKFMKRLRRRFDGRRIRYFHVGEYGARYGRPHYHALLFGFDFPDKVPWTRRGDFPVFRSGVLEELWRFGRSEIGTVTFESAAYVARYITKKVTGNELVKEARYTRVDRDTGEVFRNDPEYATMSRNPGIGKAWFDKYGSEVYPDGVLVRGRLCKPPRFYDTQFELSDPEAMEEIRQLRSKQRNRAEETPERLEVRAEVAKARLNLKRRDLE